MKMAIFNTRGYDLIGLFQELKQVVENESCNEQPLPLHDYSYTLKLDLHIFGEIIPPGLKIIISSRELKISFFGNSTPKCEIALKGLQRGGRLIHEWDF